MKLFSEKLLLGFGEQIIYTGEERNVEFFYINPFAIRIFKFSFDIPSFD